MSNEKYTVGKIEFSPYKSEKLKPLSKEQISIGLLAIRDPEKLAEKYIELQAQINQSQLDLEQANNTIKVMIEKAVAKHKPAYDEQMQKNLALQLKLEKANKDIQKLRDLLVLIHSDLKTGGRDIGGSLFNKICEILGKE